MPEELELLDELELLLEELELLLEELELLELEELAVGAPPQEARTVANATNAALCLYLLRPRLQLQLIITFSSTLIPDPENSPLLRMEKKKKYKITVRIDRY